MTSIFELSKEIKEITNDIKEKEQEHKDLMNALNSRKSELTNTLNNHLKGLDADKMDKGAEVVYVRGNATSQPRKDVVKSAINCLLNEEGKSLQNQYFGIKNYDAFGDQGCDCEYGMGPTYGSIVFEVGLNPKYRTGEIKPELLECAIYYLANLSK